MTYLTAAGLSALQSYESGGDPYAISKTTSASGLYGFVNSTWQQYAALVPGASIYPTARDAPPGIQTAVASVTPVSNWTCPGCDPSFTSALQTNPQWISGTPDSGLGSGTLILADPTLGGSDYGGTGTTMESLPSTPSGLPACTFIDRLIGYDSGTCNPVPNSPSNPGASGAASGTSGISATLQTLFSADTWQRVGLVFIGAVILLAALFLFGFGQVFKAEIKNA